MWRLRARDAGFYAIAAASSAGAQTLDLMRPGITVAPAKATVPPPATSDLDDGSQLLQLEVFINGRAVDLVVPFTMHADGKLGTAASQLSNLGIRLPAGFAAKELEVALDSLPGVTFSYDEAAQAIHFTLAPSAQQPTRIAGRDAPPAAPDPQRPPFGAIVNYTLFASADKGSKGVTFDGVSGEFETRIFGGFGLVENTFIGRTGATTPLLRLDSTYSYEDPAGLVTFVAGDFVSSGFSWTRPIRMGGLQVRRSFELRPDLITVPLPSFTGSAAAPSTLDLYVDSVRTLSTKVPQGPYEIDHPPIVYGSGQAQIVLRDALGRETVSTTSFYASPDLLETGLTDFSAELGFARRNYATFSNDYDGRPVASASYRHGVSPSFTAVAHSEAAGGGMAMLGGGGFFTLGTKALASVALAGSRTPSGTGALIDISIESRMAHLSLLFRTQRTFGDYQDLASWTAASSPNKLSERSIYGQPREIDQASVSLPLWRGSSAGLSYVKLIRADEGRSRVGNLSFTQQIGKLALFASASRDFDVARSTSFFAGLSIPLGHKITASTGGNRAHGATSGYIEASRQGAHEPGAFGWSLRASDGTQKEAQAILRYSSNFAQFEATELHSDGQETVTGLMEGALSLVGGLHATTRLDDSFAIVEVGAPGIAVMRENHQVGVTGKNGNLLVPDLAPFVSNRISINPEGLPIDARVEATETTTTPFSRVPAKVDLRVEVGRGSALIMLVDPQGKPIELGSSVTLEGKGQDFVVGYDGESYIEDLGPENALLVTTPDGATCHAKFHFHAVPGEQVKISATTCTPGP